MHREECRDCNGDGATIYQVNRSNCRRLVRSWDYTEIINVEMSVRTKRTERTASISESGLWGLKGRYSSHAAYNRISMEMGFGFRFIRLNEAISFTCVGEHLLRNWIHIRGSLAGSRKWSKQGIHGIKSLIRIGEKQSPSIGPFDIWQILSEREYRISLSKCRSWHHHKEVLFYLIYLVQDSMVLYIQVTGRLQS